jgi:hypothetical protein
VVAMCAAFMATWVAAIIVRMTGLWRAARTDSDATPRDLRSARATKGRVDGKDGSTPGVTSVAPASRSNGECGGDIADSLGVFVVTNPLRAAQLRRAGAASTSADGKMEHNSATASGLSSPRWQRAATPPVTATRKGSLAAAAQTP